MAANTHNAMIGGNLAKLRQQSGLTQEDVAGQMRNKYGYKWSKATVWAVESGERPLKLTEAQDVLKCLGLDWIVFLPMLLQGEETSDELEIKRQILRRRFESVGVPELAALILISYWLLLFLQRMMKSPGRTQRAHSMSMDQSP